MKTQFWTLLVLVMSILWTSTLEVTTACEPDCDDCEMWNGYDCVPDECIEWEDCPNGGWCCDCIDCVCIDDDSWCDTCYGCNGCGCECVTVTSIGRMATRYCIGDSTTVTAYLSDDLPSGCSITWGGSATFSNISGNTATATFNTTGSLVISAKTSCQAGTVYSSSFVVYTLSSVSADRDTADLCEYVTFTANTTPAGYGSDTAWGAPDGDPSSGTGSTLQTRWRCKADNKYARGTLCNDGYRYDYVDIVLPSGCSEAGSHDSSTHWDHTTDTDVSSLGSWGLFTPSHATYDFEFKYESCTWVCEISNLHAETEIQVLKYNYPGYVSVLFASDVPCVDANLALSDLYDPNIYDDQGAPYSKYWSHTAVVAHEMTHRSDWVNYYGAEVTNAVSYCESVAVVTVNCSYPETTTCQSVKNGTAGQLVPLRFQFAWLQAWAQMNDPNTALNEAEQRAYLAEEAILSPIVGALPGGCTP